MLCVVEIHCIFAILNVFSIITEVKNYIQFAVTGVISEKNGIRFIDLTQNVCKLTKHKLINLNYPEKDNTSGHKEHEIQVKYKY